MAAAAATATTTSIPTTSTSEIATAAVSTAATAVITAKDERRNALGDRSQQASGRTGALGSGAATATESDSAVAVAVATATGAVRGLVLGGASLSRPSLHGLRPLFMRRRFVCVLVRRAASVKPLPP